MSPSVLRSLVPKETRAAAGSGEPGPGSATPSPGDGPGDSSLERRLTDVAVSLGIGVLGFACYFLWAILLLSLVQPFVEGEIGDVHAILVNPPALALGMFTATAIYLRRSSLDWSYVDARVPTLREAGYALLGIAVLLGAAVAIDWLVAQFGVTPAEHGTVETVQAADPRVLLYLVAASIVFIGPAEEIVFRNLVQKRLADSFRPAGAIAIASAIFAIVHWQAYASGTVPQRLSSLAIVFALSLALGWIYHRTRNLVVVALAHGGYDAVLFASLYVGLSVA